LSESINLNYNFSVDNDLNTFEQNSIGIDLDFNYFSNSFKFNETNGKIGDTNIFENSSTIKFNDDNFF
jgi:LPS-assembly protein